MKYYPLLGLFLLTLSCAAIRPRVRAHDDVLKNAELTYLETGDRDRALDELKEASLPLLKTSANETA